MRYISNTPAQQKEMLAAIGENQAIEVGTTARGIEQHALSCPVQPTP